MQLINGALFLNVNATLFFVFCFLFGLSGSVTVTSPFTTMYASLKSHKSDFNVGVLILIFLLTL